MPTFTTNYSLALPLVNNATDQDLWGGYLNTDISSIDTLLRQGITYTTSSQTSSFTASASISVKTFYLCDATSGAITVTMPSASSAGAGACLGFKKTDSSANTVSISTSLDGSSPFVLSQQYQAVNIVSDGTTWQVWTRYQKNLSIVLRTFTADGTYTPTTGMLYCIAEGVGSGGSGGGGNNIGGSTPGSGGGGAAYSRRVLSAAQIGASQVVTIGAAVSGGGATSDGTDGNTTSLGSLLVASGGKKGLKNAGAPTAGGVGGSTGTGDIIIPGTQGQWVSAEISMLSSFGGNSYLGVGGSNVVGSNITGSTAVSYGGGGGGGTGSAGGGTSGAGVLYITEFVYS